MGARGKERSNEWLREGQQGCWGKMVETGGPGEGESVTHEETRQGRVDMGTGFRCGARGKGSHSKGAGRGRARLTQGLRER